MDDLLARYRHQCSLLGDRGQQQVLRFWDDLASAQCHRLIAELESLDWDLLDRLIDSHVLNRPQVAVPENLEPVEPLPCTPAAADAASYQQAQRLGETLIGQGRVAALTVAGGQGTRLGFEGPKGAYPIGPASGRTLFQWFAEFLRRCKGRFGRPIAWYIMTSPSNDADTRAYFAEHEWLGLTEDDVRFFVQGQMPAFSRDGKLLLADRDRLALSPDGHGGTLRALAASGALAGMAEAGIEHLSYFQVDNPLVKFIDPLFIGLHAETGSQMSSKTIPKADDLERVGNFVLADGRLTVIEYSDLPEALAHARNADGSRRFDAGSIAIHVLDRRFVERLTGRGGDVELPWHRADKKVSHLDPDTGRRIEPDEPNAIKLETFIFDAIPLADRPLLLATRRDEEFSPVKKATGTDSAQTAQRDLIRRAARWLETCGFEVPRRDDGEPDAKIEISPALALDAEDLCGQLRSNPMIQPGDSICLEA